MRDEIERDWEYVRQIDRSSKIGIWFEMIDDYNERCFQIIRFRVRLDIKIARPLSLTNEKCFAYLIQKCLNNEMFLWYGFKMFADVSLAAGMNMARKRGKDACPLVIVPSNTLFSCFLYTTEESLFVRRKSMTARGWLAALYARAVLFFLPTLTSILSCYAETVHMTY